MKILIAVAFVFHCYAGEHWDEEQVTAYVHHSELQRCASWHLLSRVQFQGNERVLDVGCGDGRNSAWLSWQLRQGSVIGIDPSKAMLSWAKKQYHPLDFPNLSFMDGDAYLLPKGLFDVITCFYSLHMVQDKQSAIQGFFHQLKPGGRVIVTLPASNTNQEWSEAIGETMGDIKWKSYFKDFKTPFRFEKLEAFIRYFEEAGFSIVHAKYVPSIDPFINRKEAILWFLGTFPHIHYLPKELQGEFFGDMIDRYIEKRPSAYSEDGVIYFYWGHDEIIAEKA
jgi:trans-aconitate 2-methyltransferase